MPVGLSLDAASTLSLSRLQYPSATRTRQREIFREKPTSAVAYLPNNPRLSSTRLSLKSHRIELNDASACSQLRLPGRRIQSNRGGQDRSHRATYISAAPRSGSGDGLVRRHLADRCDAER